MPKSKETDSGQLELHTRSAALLRVPIRRTSLLSILASGVLRCDAAKGERPRISPSDTVHCSEPNEWVVAEIPEDAMDRVRASSLVPVVDIDRVVFPDQEQLDWLLAKARAYPGMPSTFPGMTADESVFVKDPDGEPDFDEPDHSEPASDGESRLAAAFIVLCSQLQERPVDVVTDALLPRSSDSACTIDDALIVNALAAACDISQELAGLVLKWQSNSNTAGLDSSDRFQALTGIVRNAEIFPDDTLDTWESCIAQTIAKTRMPRPGELNDSDGSQPLLRVLMAIFRMTNIELPAAESFIEAERSQDSESVSPRIDLAIRLISAWTCKGFPSMTGNPKTEPDLYGIGCCLSAGQFDRVEVQRAPGRTGFEVLRDGERVDAFAAAAGEAHLPPPKLRKLHAIVEDRGFAPSEIIEMDSFTVEEEHSVLVKICDSQRMIEFSSKITLEKRRRKSFPQEFLISLLGTRLRCESVISEFPHITVIRDQIMGDADDAEVADHLSCVMTASRRIKELWDFHVPAKPIAKKKGAKKRGGKKTGDRTPNEVT